ncbi:hypothetical protein HRG_013080 [Hirsutella rhossiliensis]
MPALVVRDQGYQPVLPRLLAMDDFLPLHLWLRLRPRPAPWAARSDVAPSLPIRRRNDRGCCKAPVPSSSLTLAHLPPSRSLFRLPP